MMRQVQYGRELFHGFGPYDILKYMSPGLLIDVGAAAGTITNQMLRLSPESRVIAFEPFPGNFPYIEKACGKDERITIRRDAVGETNGETKFVVAKTVEGTEPGWENKVGYSSGGYLARKDVSASIAMININCVRLDEAVNELPKYLKIDVQGGELGVLKGAKRLLNEGISIIYCEYSGQEGVLELLLDNKYVLFDSEYLIVPRSNDDQLNEWNIVGKKNLSSGRSAFSGWPIFRSENAEEYEIFMREQRPRRMIVQTDLFCVHSGYFNEFKKIRCSHGNSSRVDVGQR